MLSKNENTILSHDQTFAGYRCTVCGALDSDPELLEKHEAQHRFMRDWIRGQVSAVLNVKGGYHKIRTNALVCVDCKDPTREVAVKNRCQRCYQRKARTKVAPPAP